MMSLGTAKEGVDVSVDSSCVAREIGPFVGEAVHIQAHFLARLNFGIEDVLFDRDGLIDTESEDTVVVQDIERLLVYRGRYLQNVQAFCMPWKARAPEHHISMTEDMEVDHPIDLNWEWQCLLQRLANCLRLGKYNRVEGVHG